MFSHARTSTYISFTTTRAVIVIFCYIYKNYEHIKSVNQKKENLSFTPELTFDAAFYTVQNVIH